MQRATREVTLNIGKGVYTVSTPLDTEALDRVKGLIDEACGRELKGAGQEDMLVLGLLRLAYGLDAVRGKLEGIAGNMDAGVM